jgi:hypothetical protein
VTFALGIRHGGRQEWRYHQQIAARRQAEKGRRVSIIQSWPMVVATCSLVAAVQWWMLRRIHRKNIAEMRLRHLNAQESIGSLLQQARQQLQRTQAELAELRAIAKAKTRPTASRSAPGAAVRDRLNKMLDSAPERGKRLPVDGFADTLPSLQFAQSSSFDLLHRPSTFA